MALQIDSNVIAAGQAGHLGYHRDISDVLAAILGTTAGSTIPAPAAIGITTGRSASITVAASNTSAARKANADFVCTGTADDVVINAAIAALPGVGGRVMLLEGTFWRSAPIVIDKSFVILEGQGSASTNLKASNSGVTGIAAIIVGQTKALSGCGVKNLQVNDSGAVNGTPTSGSAHGIAFACNAGILQNVVVQACAGDEFHIGQDQVAFALNTTVAVASNGAALPQGTLNVASTAGFAAAGSLIVATSSGPAYCIYTATAGGNQFTGCSWSFPGASSALATGGVITQPGQLFDLTAINCYAQNANAPAAGIGFYVDYTYSSCEFFACRAEGAPAKPVVVAVLVGFLIYGTQIKLYGCHAYFWEAFGLQINAQHVFTGGAVTVFGGEWETNAGGALSIFSPSSLCYLNGLQFYGNGIGTGQSDIQLNFGAKTVRMTGCTFRKGGNGSLAQNIYMQAASYIYIHDCEFDYPAIARAVFVDGSGAGDTNPCSYVFIRNNRCTAANAGTNFVQLNGDAQHCELSDNVTDASIAEVTATSLTPDNNVIRNNTIVPGNSAVITVLGAHTRAYDNPGAPAGSGPVLGWRQVTKAATYAALWGDSVWASGTFTITSPPAQQFSRFRVKNTGVGTITVSPASGTIDGAASWSTAVQYVSAEFESDGVNWSVIT